MHIHTPVVPTQTVYRQLLQAMSHPGRVYAVDAGEWDSLLLAVCETLLDHEVSFAVWPGESREGDAVFAATKARRTSLEEADYILVFGHESGGAVAEAKTGIPPFPDQGATILYVMDEPAEAGTPPALSGPGCADAAPPGINPLTEAEWRLLKEKNEEYPLGVDAICLVGADRVLAIPRSTRIKVD